MMKALYIAALASALVIQPVNASEQRLHDLIQSKCEIEFSPRIAREKAAYYEPLIEKYANKHGLPPKVVAALIWHESNYRPRCTSSCGALGLMQVVPYPGRFPRGADPYDPETNLDVGCRVLQGYLLQFHGDWHRALTAYNWGDGRVSRGMYRSDYSRAVLRSAGR